MAHFGKRLQKVRERFVHRAMGPAGRGRGCIAAGCKRSVEAGQILCHDCLRRVPRDLQSEVRDAWRACRRAALRLERNPAEIEDAQNHYNFLVGEATAIASRRPAVEIACQTCGVEFFGPPGTTRCHRHREAAA